MKKVCPIKAGQDSGGPDGRFADSATTVHPVCSNGGVPMWLIRIQPDKARCARRTFECPRCQNQLSEVVELQKTAS